MRSDGLGRGLCLAAALLAGCVCGDAEVPLPPRSGILRAMAGEASRTVLDGVKVRWSAGDDLAVWSDRTSVAVRYVAGDAAEGAVSAEFAGEPVEGTLFRALYPFDSEAECDDGGTVRFTLPVVQRYAEGSFAPRTMPMLAEGDDLMAMRFRSLCAVVRFRLEGDARIRALRLEATDGRALAGRGAAVGEGEERRFAMERGDAAFVWLDCGEGGVALDGGRDFFFVVPPGGYDGLRLTVFEVGGGAWVRRSRGGVTLRANAVKPFDAMACDFADGVRALDAAGTANCYMVTEAGRYAFDAETCGNGVASALFRDGASLRTRLAPASAGVLWQSRAGLLSEAVLDADGRIVFRSADPGGGGNALIAARDETGTILWSWHIWLCGDDPDAAVQHYGEVGVMDRHLGAWSPSQSGCFYQWGRKEPFPPFAEATGSNLDFRATVDATGASCNSRPTVGLTAWPQREDWATVRMTGIRFEQSCAHPMALLLCEPNRLHWLAEESLSEDLWGPCKRMNDPCPPGYRVVGEEELRWLSEQTCRLEGNDILFEWDATAARYPAASRLTDKGKAKATAFWDCWSSASTGGGTAAGLTGDKATVRANGSLSKYFGAQVRCRRDD